MKYTITQEVTDKLRELKSNGVQLTPELIKKVRYIVRLARFGLGNL